MEHASAAAGKCRLDVNMVVRYIPLYVKGEEYYLNPKDVVRTA